MPTRADAEALDAADPLAAVRDLFEIDDASPIYADGNSLGRLSRASRAALEHHVAQEWGRTLIGSWDEWFDLPERVGDAIGRHFLGAAAGQTVVADSTTVNFYKLAVAALRSSGRRRVVVTDRGNFPTDRFVLQGLDVDIELVPEDPSTADVAAVLDRRRGEIALVTLSLVSYRSGALLDLPAITRASHEHGALVLWDLSHAVGAVEVGLDAHDVDLAVGCTYKYLNGGPGAPAFLYVASRLHGDLRNPIQGWFGADDQFAMGADYSPAPGVRQFLSGTPPVTALRSVEAAVDTLRAAGIGPLAAKGRQLSAFTVELADERLEHLGFTVATPRQPDARGAHVALRHDDAWRICQALIAAGGVVPDFREPDIVRLGFAPAYTRFVDVYDAIERIDATVAAGRHLAMPAERRRVT
ncbi:MAG TPA: kynureninase [Acidimicrobiales bacterium]|jgi:kynureninase|nr:kynureninase [Acidimicrobiales bacterium]